MGIRRSLDVTSELLEGFEHCCLVTEYLVGVLPTPVWRAEPPAGKGRTIAAIVAHIHSLRRTFARMGGARRAGASIDRLRSSPADARRALRQSRQALTGQFREALTDGRTRVKGMPRRTVDMMLYLVQHEAHHRGQIATLARSLGHSFAPEDLTRLWGWRKLP